jgi:hypothetical protein
VRTIADVIKAQAARIRALENENRDLRIRLEKTDRVPADPAGRPTKYGPKRYVRTEFAPVALSIRAANALHNNGIDSIEKFLELDVEQTLRWKHVGATTRMELRDAQEVLRLA